MKELWGVLLYLFGRRCGATYIDEKTCSLPPHHNGSCNTDWYWRPSLNKYVRFVWFKETNLGFTESRAEIADVPHR
jgi:hypothetical protein